MEKLILLPFKEPTKELLMKLVPVLCGLLIVLSGCGNHKETPAPKQTPQNESEIQKITYHPGMEDFLLIPDQHDSNIYVLSLPINQSGEINITFKAQNISGAVKSIMSYSSLVIPQNCVKNYEVDEVCSSLVSIGSQVTGPQILRVATTKGNKFLRIYVARTGKIVTGTPDVRLENELQFGTVVSKNAVIKLVTIKNYGADTTINKLELTGIGDYYRIVYNNCLNRVIKKSASCAVRVALDGRNKPSGNVAASLVVGAVGQEDKTSTVAANVIEVDNSNEPPQIGLSSFYAVSGSSLTVDLQATDLEGDSLTYYVDPSLGSIDTSGNFNFLPESGKATGTTGQVTVGVSDGKHPMVYKNLTVNYLAAMVYTGNSSFPEGEVKTPLFTMALNAGQKILNITTNLNSFLTATKISGTGVLGMTNPLIKNNSLPINSGNNGVVTYQIEGAIKYAGSYELLLEVTLNNGQIVNYKKPITVTSQGLPYLKYDIYAVKNTSGSYNGYDGNEIGVSVKELARQYSAWRTPILVRLTNEPIVCGGSEMTTYDASQTSMKNCLANLASTDAESAFYFQGVYSGANQIGGIANGTRKSLVVEKFPWDHTLAHELGHQFGLWHTFETFWNDYIFHCSSSDFGSCNYYELVENLSGKNKSTPGDWANTRVDYYSSTGLVNLVYTASDDTAKDYFGGKVTTINNLFSAVIPNTPYVNGDQVVLSYGGQSYSSNSGFPCLQNLSGNSILQNGELIRYYVNCTSIPGSGSFVMSNETVKNTMSYWYHESGSARFSPNQKLRMDQVINQFSELSQP